MLVCPRRASTLRYSFPALQQNYTQWRAYHQKKESALHYLITYLSSTIALCASSIPLIVKRNLHFLDSAPLGNPPTTAAAYRSDVL